MNGMQPIRDKNKMTERSDHMSPCGAAEPYALDIAPRTPKPANAIGQTDIVFVKSDVSLSETDCDE